MSKRNIISMAAGFAVNVSLKFAVSVVAGKSLGAWTGADMKAKSITKAYRDVPLPKAIIANALVLPFVLFGYRIADRATSEVVQKVDAYLEEKELA